MAVQKEAGFYVSKHTIERLSLYRRLLFELIDEGRKNIHSYQLADISGNTPSQVRRDIMAVGYYGNPNSGYDVRELIESIGDLLDARKSEKVILVGLGNLGRAILSHFSGRHPNLAITAAFDIDPDKTDRVVHGCRCYLTTELRDFIAQHNICAAIIAVPASKAQSVANQLVRAGVTGILNYTPTKLRTPPEVYVENRDMTTALEKVAYFARQRSSKRVEVS